MPMSRKKDVLPNSTALSASREATSVRSTARPLGVSEPVRQDKPQPSLYRVSASRYSGRHTSRFVVTTINEMHTVPSRIIGNCP
jgi:hypothetical protein